MARSIIFVFVDFCCFEKSFERLKVVFLRRDGARSGVKRETSLTSTLQHQRFSLGEFGIASTYDIF